MNQKELDAEELKNLDIWIEEAKFKFNSAMDKAKDGRSKVRIKWRHNPQQTVEVEPDTETDFDAKNVTRNDYYEI